MCVSSEDFKVGRRHKDGDFQPLWSCGGPGAPAQPSCGGINPRPTSVLCSPRLALLSHFMNLVPASVCMCDKVLLDREPRVD